MTKFTKISAMALFALFLTACDKPANKTAEATPTAQTITAEEMAQGKADLQKIVAWDKAQKEAISKANQFLQEKLATQDSRQIVEAVGNFTKQVTNVSNALDALDIKTPAIVAFRAQAKEVLALSNEVITTSLQIPADPNNEALRTAVQQKTQQLVEKSNVLEKFLSELHAKFGVK